MIIRKFTDDNEIDLTVEQKVVVNEFASLSIHHLSERFCPVFRFCGQTIEALFAHFSVSNVDHRLSPTVGCLRNAEI